VTRRDGLAVDGVMAVIVVLVGWSVLAFGAVYPWAYIPLAIGAVTAGGLGLTAPGRLTSSQRFVAILIAGVAVAVAVQLIPLPQSIIATISPETDALLRNYDLGYAAESVGGRATHPLSIDPSRTRLALILFSAFSILMFGAAHMIATAGLKALLRGLVGLGALIALIGIVQKPMYAGAIYGFWMPEHKASPFGPFVNRNHFAGWMLMMLPLAAGYLAGRAANVFRHDSATGWRPALRRLTSNDGHEIILVGVAALIMAVALMFTLSRSAAIALLLEVSTLLFLGIRSSLRRIHGVWVGFFLLAVTVMAAGWVGLDSIGRRFVSPEMETLSGRLEAWQDAQAIAQRFPLAGTGINTYGVATLFFQRADLAHHYDAAHSDYLQLAAEGGILVLIPVIVAVSGVVFVGRQQLRQAAGNPFSYWTKAGAIAGLVGIAGQEAFEFSLQIPANAALFAVIAGIAISSTPSAPRT
jgi:hypothetical protein